MAVNPGQEDFGARLLTADVGDVRITVVYCPNGKHVEHDDYRRKLAWFEQTKRYGGLSTAAKKRLDELMGDDSVSGSTPAAPAVEALAEIRCTLNGQKISSATFVVTFIEDVER